MGNTPTKEEGDRSARYRSRSVSQSQSHGQSSRARAQSGAGPLPIRSSDLNVASTRRASASLLASLEGTLLGLDSSFSSSHTRGSNSYFNNPVGTGNSPSSSRRKKRKEREKEKELEAQRELELANEMKIKWDEIVDGGYLGPHGVYTATQDFNIYVVKQLIIDRRLAPFFKPLEDYDDNLDDLELYNAIHEAEFKETGSSKTNSSNKSKDKITNGLDFNLELDVQKSDSVKSFDEVPPEVAIYRNGVECPICFLYYPDQLNTTRCCGQPICTECFVQIKRSEPHYPHDNDQNSNTNNETLQPDKELISEPALCPYCAMSEFGVCYTPPPKKWGISSSLFTDVSSTPGTSTLTPPVARTRAGSIPPNNPNVISIDQIRPDWQLKLVHAKAKLARRAAAATAIHASSLMLNTNVSGSNGRWRRPSRIGLASNRRNEISTSLVDQASNDRALADMEERMIMEAIRISILEQETRELSLQNNNNNDNNNNSDDRKRSSSGTDITPIEANDAQSPASSSQSQQAQSSKAQSNTTTNNATSILKDNDSEGSSLL